MTHPPSPAADLVTETLTVAGRAITIAHPRSAEDLIDEREYERDERLPYWADLWPSAHVLADALAARDLNGVRVLEVGCGVGLPAIVAALGGARVLASDWYQPALAQAAANARANGARVDTLLLDWRHPPAALMDGDGFDLIVGADVLYEERNGVALAELLPGLCRARGEILIADPRRPHADALIEPLRTAGWHHAVETHAHRRRVDESGALINLHRLHPPRR